MLRTWYVIGLTVLSLAATACLVSLLVRPVPVDWLIEHGDSLQFVSEYASVEPVMARWKNGPPDAGQWSNVWRLALERPYAYMTRDTLQQFINDATPEFIETRVRRAMTVLLSPCSLEMKNRVMADPLGLVDRVGPLVSPACTAASPALFVCTFGRSKEASLQAAEATARHLAELELAGVIGPYQSAASFLRSSELQAARHGDLNRQIDSFRLTTIMEQSLATRKVDRNTFRRFFDLMKQIAATTTRFDTVTIQEKRLDLLGLSSLTKHFFMPCRGGYVCVHRVLPASGTTLADARAVIEPVLRRNYIDAVVTCPEHVARQYYALVTAGLWVVGALWLLGILVPLLADTMRRGVLRLVLGRDARIHTRTLHLAPGYQAFLGACGIGRFGDLVRLGHPLRRGEQRLFAIEEPVAPTGNRGHARRQLTLRLPFGDAMPGVWRDRGACVLQATYARGSEAIRLGIEHRCHLHLRAQGVLTLPLVAFGDGFTDAGRYAVQVLAITEGYESFSHWQSRVSAMPPSAARDRLKRAMIHEIARVVGACHAAGFRRLPWHEGAWHVRATADGGVRLRAGSLAGLADGNALRRVLYRVLPFLDDAGRRHDYVRLNRSLFMELFSLHDRVRLLLLCARRARLTAAERRFIHMLAAGDDAARYHQYVRQGDLSVNLAERARLDSAPAQTVDKYLRIEGGRQVTRKRGRTVVAISAGNETWYLKRHAPVSLLGAVRKWFEYRRFVSHARAEWEANARVLALGIPTVPLVAMGERRAGLRDGGSFIVTAELPHGQSLEKLLAGGPALPMASRIALAQRLGDLARRLHEAGWVHRDFYLGHIYVVGALAGEYRLHLLDVQRLRRGAVPGNRWSLKDVAALQFSSLPLSLVRGTDRLRFLHAYFPRVPFAALKPFIGRVARKVDQVARHTERLLGRRRKRGELPSCNL